MPTRRGLIGFVLAVALFPGGARAQTLTHSFEDLQQILKLGQSVVVTDESGRNAKGTVEQLSDSSITVGTRLFTEAAVREIRLRDPLWNGVLIGAGIGAGLATWDYVIDPSEPGNAIVFTVAISIGAGIGAGIDALKGGKVIYASTRRPRGVMVLPVIQRGRQGALASVYF